MPLIGGTWSWLGPVIGDVIIGMPAWQRAHLGLSRSFQIPRPFADMTVLENLLVPLDYLLVPAIPIILAPCLFTGSPGESAFTRVFDALCPATARA